MLCVLLPRPKQNDASARLAQYFTAFFFFLWESVSVLLAHYYIFFHGQYLLLEVSSDKSHFV